MGGFGGEFDGSTYPGDQDGAGAHRFDTGLFRSQRSAIRAHIAARLGDLLKVNGGYVIAIRDLPRPLRGQMPDELAFIAEAVSGTVPAILIALGRKDFAPLGMDIPPTHFTGEVEVVLYAVTSSARSLVAGRLTMDGPGAADPTADPGMEAFLEHIEERLAGQTIDLSTTHELRPQHEDEVYTGGDYTVWEQRYLLVVERELNPERDNTKILVSIEAKNNLDGADPANPVVDTVSTLEIA